MGNFLVSTHGRKNDVSRIFQRYLPLSLVIIVVMEDKSFIQGLSVAKVLGIGL